MEKSTRTIARKRYRKCFFFIVLYFLYGRTAMTGHFSARPIFTP